MKNILIITESINVEDSSGSKANVDIINNLKRCGYNIKVYHYTRKDITIDGVDCVAISEKKVNLYYILSKIILVFWRVTNKDVNPFFEKRFGFSFAFFNDVNSITKSLKKETTFNPDWVLTLSKAASFRVHKALLKIPHWHSKWLAYVHDPYPTHFYPRPYNWVGPGYHQREEFFRDVSKKSAHAIFPSQLLMEWMGSYYPDFLERGFVVPHQMSDKIEISQNTPDYFKDTYFTILHAGSVMKQRNPSGLIEGFQLFLESNPEAKANSQLLFLGKKSDHQAYLNIKKSEIPQLFLSDGYVSFKDVLTMQNKASVNVILEAKSEISPFLPGKFPHCVKANKPILYLGPKQSETLRLLGESYAYASEIDEVNHIAKHIEQLYFNWKGQTNLQFLNRPDLEAYLSFNNLKETFENIKA